MKSILLIEDEKALRDTLANFLQEQTYKVDTAHSYKSAVEALLSRNYHLVIVDVGLPDGSGLNLIPHVKQMHEQTALIIVSARDKIEQRVEGLEKGADDYITKPFHLSELNARINSVLRRYNKEEGYKLQFNELELFLDDYRLLVNGEELKLTQTEFELLSLFVSNRNRLLTKEAIIRHINNSVSYENNFSDDFVYTHIKNLRKKLIKAQAGNYIQSVYGVGYKFGEK